MTTLFTKSKQKKYKKIKNIFMSLIARSIDPYFHLKYKIEDWKLNLSTVMTCNSLPVIPHEYFIQRHQIRGRVNRVLPYFY